MTKVLAFGTFDGIHEGHRAMLREAKTLGSYLIVAVAPDSVVAEIKGAVPHNRAAKRIADLKKEHIADEVALGDAMQGDWKILKKYKPDSIALGYDQDELKQALIDYYENAEKKPTIVVLQPYKPDIYKSSLMNHD